jgi:hypothetical protein
MSGNYYGRDSQPTSAQQNASVHIPSRTHEVPMPETKRRGEDISCPVCGAALHVQAGTRDTAIMRCEICQSTIGSWADVKEHARKRREDSGLRVARSR